jgi:hypothetical protein
LVERPIVAWRFTSMALLAGARPRLYQLEPLVSIVCGLTISPLDLRAVHADLARMDSTK